MGQKEATSSNKGIALTCEERKNMKGKKEVERSSSLSEDEGENDGYDDDEQDDQASTLFHKFDENTLRIVGKMMRMILKMNLMSVSIQVEDIIFNIDRKEQRNKGCFRCNKKRRFVKDCPNKTISKDKKRGARPYVNQDL